MEVVLGVGGGIAAYKAALLLRLMKEAGHGVTVVPTDNALRFVGAPTWEALSGRPVRTDTFTDVPEVSHVRLGREADLVVVAPATADLLARTAAGMAPDLLGNVLLTATCPVVLAPAMHTEMWRHPATVANVALLRERGVHVIEPDSGRLTGADSGPGRLPEPARIWAEAQDAAARAGGRAGREAAVTAAEPGAASPLAGRTVVISAGGTREALDPVRFLGNRSSGKQGTALAEAVLAAGARVRFIAGPMSVAPPAGTEVTAVESTQELLEAVLSEAADADVLIMAAAVADFRPAQVATSKIKKTDDGGAPTIVLERTPDVLATAVQTRDAGGPMAPVIVGFAAETGDEHTTPLEYGRAKLARKGCDLLVVNEVGDGKVFGQDATEVTVLSADGAEPVTRTGSKAEAAAAVVEALERVLASREAGGAPGR
ncbi:bifunctional phosphopantothenoylcysteine decarboxylase/phosphopantothenate--cysteine ligase CoaBC [Micrococcus porci]|uniref:bifunctional phosphopantothenoylcysteine decarboxylase/phosphopantothenate--cysteine ligase CoaBC n=1 Tax=Micrococcus porci TaxID=2856555 RepID=UPI001CCF2E37|nr:bifunctional phosphopantothenoylcysteine decarboxylase/phosphopantothenate--cysteine ligase CoaBC [Micrococcus porci]UBH23802.1 bifunctional phosphopantothenoylcysteine decarboxylase/phosphopantothenate--cysteine ligase CoaBC [Micrococcus porci]